MYFDGKKTTDEILFRTEMTRRQFREVLHQFEDYVSEIVLLIGALLTIVQLIVFLHP